MKQRRRMITYGEEVAAELCRQLARGRSLAAVCARPDMPATSTVRRWRRTRPEFAARLTAARSAGGYRAPVPLTERVFTEICERIAHGEFLTAICRDRHMPCRRHVHRRLSADPDWLRRYREARELQAEHLLEEILAIADGDDDPTRARLRIETRKWLVARLVPDAASGDKKEGAVDRETLDKARGRAANAE